MSTPILFYSLLGGVLPTLLWLWFWCKEDRLHPEPRGLLMASFMGGMIAVLIALPAEQWVWSTFAENMTLIIISWAVIEEVLKYAASYFIALRRKENDEPIDSLIYLITAALGFAALENTLFLSGAFEHGGLASGFDLGVLRFIGASLLHVIASGTMGFFLALGFYRRRSVREMDWVLGLFSSIILHALFNLFILKSAGNGIYTFTVFSFVWLAVILLLVGFEKVKQLKA
jgi:RsiW-degrading membrane proteinase PrsW (M82 family)